MNTCTQQTPPNVRIFEIPGAKDHETWIADIRRHAYLLRCGDQGDMPEAAREAELNRLEDRIFTVQPTTMREVRILLLLLTRMILARRELEPTYLSDVLEECAAAVAIRGKTDIRKFAIKGVRPH